MFIAPPEFFDIFGFIGFIFISLVAAVGLKTKRAIPNWMLRLLLLVGVLGAIVDGIIVYINYLI